MTLPSRDAALQVGYAEADITPPLDGSMPGYFTDRRATGILDPLWAKVLFLRMGEESIALVACDLIEIPAGVVRRVRAEVARAGGTAAPRHVWIHGTHTHTGGMLPRGDVFTSDAETLVPGFFAGQLDHTWVEEFIRKTSGAVLRAAQEATVERRVTLAEGREVTVAFYRRFRMRDGTVRTNPGRNNPEVVEPAGQVDSRLHALRCHDRRIALVLYGLHPDCTGGTLYSADYPAALSDALREGLGPGWCVLFLNAACANVNHIDVRDESQRSGADEARRIGRRLAAAAIEALSREQPLEPDCLHARSATVRCPLRRPAPADLAEAEERLRAGRTAGEFNGLFPTAAVVLARTRDRLHTAEIAALRLGCFGLAAMPGEIFVELAREVEEAAPSLPTRTVGLTNGAMGYIPTRGAFAEGGYETGYRSARYDPESGHRWAETAARLLRRR